MIAHKKDLGLLVLILVVGTVVALINPLLPVADQPRQYREPDRPLRHLRHRAGLRHHHRRHRPFGRLGDRPAGRALRRPSGQCRHALAAGAAADPAHRRSLIGLVHGLLIVKLKMQPFIVTLCGLLIYRGIARFYTADATAGFSFGQSFPTLEWLTVGRSFGVPALVPRLADGRHRDVGRAAPLGFRPLSLRGRKERGGRALCRRSTATGSSSPPMSSAAS